MVIARNKIIPVRYDRNFVIKTYLVKNKQVTYFWTIVYAR